MTEQEKQDTETFKRECQEIKLNTYSYMARTLTKDSRELKIAGFDSIEEALVWILKDSEKQLEKKLKSFLKKYPD
jgi:hypothetical protein